MLVPQPHESPDFRIEDEYVNVTWIEAVTANPPVPYNHYNAPPAGIAVGREALFFGSAELRFAKPLETSCSTDTINCLTLSASLSCWRSRTFRHPGRWFGVAKQLIGYLYGLGARIAEINGERRAEPVHAEPQLARRLWDLSIDLMGIDRPDPGHLANRDAGLP